MKSFDKFEFKYDRENLVKFYYCDEKVTTATRGSEVKIGKNMSVYQLENSYRGGELLNENIELDKFEKLQARPSLCWGFNNEYNVSFAAVYTGEIQLSDLDIVINGKDAEQAVLCKDGLYRMPTITISDVRYMVSAPELLLEKIDDSSNLGNRCIVEKCASNSIPTIQTIVRGRFNNDLTNATGRSNIEVIRQDIEKRFQEYGIEIKSVSIYATLHESNLNEEQKKHNDKVKNKERQNKEKDEENHKRNMSQIESMIERDRKIIESVTERDSKMITFAPSIDLINTIVNNKELIEKIIDSVIGGGGVSIGADAEGLLQLFEAMKNAMPQMLEVKDVLTRYAANGDVEVSDSMPDDITRRLV